MIIFRVIENINIKTTDGTLVSYSKLKNPSTLLNDTLYITTYEDFEDIKRVFKKVDNKYQARVIEEAKLRKLAQFPKELGISNIDEFSNVQYSKKILKTKEHDYSSNKQLISLFLNNQNANLERQIKNAVKPDISLAIIGNMGRNIGEMVTASTALRIFYERLKRKFKVVNIDIYLNASENMQYTRDKQIFSNQSFVRKVSPLSLSVKKFCTYDYFVDTSLVTNSFYYEKLNYVDAWIYKFGMDFSKIPAHKKFNHLNLTSMPIKQELKQKLQDIKLKGEIILFHPFSADANRSIPKEIASKFLKQLIKKSPNSTIVSALNIDNKIDDARYVDLSSLSKNFYDFCYIISSCDKIITTDTSTYHISDSFFIPTIVIFTTVEAKKRIEYFNCTKAIEIKDKSKNFSLFKFESNSLVLGRFDGWQELKAKKIINLLEKIC